MQPTQRSSFALHSLLKSSTQRNANDAPAQVDAAPQNQPTPQPDSVGTSLSFLGRFNRENLPGRQQTSGFRPDSNPEPAGDFLHGNGSSRCATNPEPAGRLLHGNATPRSGYPAEPAAGRLPGGTMAVPAGVLTSTVDVLQQNLLSLAQDKDTFYSAMAGSFGENWNRATAEQIRQQILAGDFSWMPDIEEVDAASLTDQSGNQGAGTAQGAYSEQNDTIYISRDTLKGDPETAVTVLTEELGHALDARLNSVDTAGDEGDVFARLVSGEDLSAADLAAMRADDDHGTIIVDGKEIEVEFRFSPLKRLTKAFGHIVSGFHHAFNRVAHFASHIISTAVSAYTSALTEVFNTLQDIGQAIDKTVRRVVNSPVFNALMAVARFVPIPIVSAVAIAYTTLQAGYQLVQGIRYGSAGMMLNGLAGLAGGAARLGTALGASRAFIGGASRLADAAEQVGQLYSAISSRNLAAALNTTASLFNGSMLANLMQTGGKFSALSNAFRTGDFGAVLTQGSSLLGGLDSGQRAQALFDDIVRKSGLITNVVNSVRRGDYSAAASLILERYGNSMGIGASAGGKLLEIAGVLETVDDLRSTLRSGSPAAVSALAEQLGYPLDAATLALLDTSLDLRDAISKHDIRAAFQAAASLASQSGRVDMQTLFNQLVALADGSDETGCMLGTVAA